MFRLELNVLEKATPVVFEGVELSTFETEHNQMLLRSVEIMATVPINCLVIIVIAVESTVDTWTTLYW